MEDGKEPNEDAAKDDKQQEQPKEQPTFTQADLDRIVKERIEREQKKAEKAAEKARKEAEEAALAEQQEFQTLAQKRQERVLELEGQVSELETVKAQAEKYEKALVSFRDAQFENLPDHIKELLEGRDVADQLEWLSKHNEAVNPQQGGARLPFTPKPKEEMTAEQRRRIAYKPRF